MSLRPQETGTSSGGIAPVLRGGAMSVTAALLLAAVTAMLFSVGTLGDFVYDDEYLIVANPEIQQLGNLRRTLLRPFWDLSGGAAAQVQKGDFYRPLVTLAYTLQFQLFGHEPLGYHLVNLGLHVLAIVLAVLWLARRLGAPGAPGVAFAAAIGATLFAWHPTRVESVTWISGCTDLFMGVFVLLGLTCWQRLRGRSSVVLTALCLTLALACKEAAVLVPAWLVLDARLHDAPGDERGPRTRAALWVLGALAVALAVRLLIVPGKLAGVGPQLVARVSSTLGHYVAVVAWPWPATVLRAPQQHAAGGGVAFAPWSIALGCAALLALGALALSARRRPGLRPALSEALFALATLAPVLQIIPLGVRPQIADRFLYLPMLGVAALCARGMHALLRRYGPIARPLALVATTPVLFAMAAGVVEHSQHFANTQALWEHELRVHPADTLPLLTLADLRIQQRRWDEGLALVQRLDRAAARDRNAAVRLKAALLAARAIGQSTPHGDRGTLQALAAFYDDLLAGRRAQLHAGGTRIALTLSPSQLSRARHDVRDVVVPRAYAYARVGRHEDAIAILEVARERARNALDVYRALALFNAQAGRFAQAREILRAAAELAPTDPGMASLRARVDHAQRLLARPDPHPGVRAATDAQAYLLLGATDMAAAALERGLAQAHEAPQLRAMLAQVDAVEGQFRSARGRIESARLQQPEAEALWQATLRDIAQLEARRAAP